MGPLQRGQEGAAGECTQDGAPPSRWSRSPSLIMMERQVRPGTKSTGRGLGVFARLRFLDVLSEPRLDGVPSGASSTLTVPPRPRQVTHVGRRAGQGTPCA